MFDLPFFDLAAQAPNHSLAFLNSSSFDSAGNEYTGNNGYTVTDSYSCGSGECGGFTMGSFPAGSTPAPTAVPVDHAGTTHLASTYTDTNGTVYTGSNGYTVTDSYTCGSGSCGGFTMGSFPSTTAPGAVHEPTHSLAFLNSSSFDGAGNEYTGNNGYTVTDSYSCGSGECGGFTMGSFPAGSTPAPAAVGTEPSLAQVPTTTLPVDPACAPDTGGSDGTCFSVTDPYNDGEGFTVWTNVYEGKMAPAPELAPIVSTTPQLAAPAGSEAKPCRASASHYLLCGHAMVLGALSATQALGQKLVDGKPLSAADWHQEFAKSSEDAVNAVSPVGGFLMSSQILSK